MARSATHLAPFVLLLAGGCAPNSAVLTEGQYWAFLSETTSFSLEKEVVDPADWPEGHHWNIDCRDLTKKEKEAIGLDDPLTKVCNDSGGVEAVYETWLSQSPFQVVHEPLDPWRGEAVITGEQDFQISFHHRLPGGEDFRFAFVVDPDFQPTECEVDEAGNLTPVPLDGDWIGAWTQDLRDLGDLNKLPSGYAILEDFIDDPDAKLYYLNARSFQFNPSNTEDIWSLPLEWQAGFAAGKFSEEEFHSRSSRYAEPALYDFVELTGGYSVETDPNDLFFCHLEEGSDPADNGCVEGKIARVTDIIDTMTEDLALVGVTDELVDDKQGLGEPLFKPLMHDNLWRPADGFPPGMDGWVEFHYNYVVISGTVEKGSSVTGAFSLVLDGDDSNSRWLVQGKFEAPNIKEDFWTTADIEAEKLEENGNIACLE